MCSLIEQKGRGREDVLSAWLLELRPWSSALGLGLTPGSQGFGPRLQLWNQFSWVSNFQTADFTASQLCEQISYNKQHTHTHTHISYLFSFCGKLRRIHHLIFNSSKSYSRVDVSFTNSIFSKPVRTQGVASVFFTGFTYCHCGLLW